MTVRTQTLWAIVTMVVAALAAVTVVTVVGASAADLLQIVSAAVVPTVTILLVGHDVAGKVSNVEKQVNGRMSELIRKVPEPETKE